MLRIYFLLILLACTEVQAQETLLTTFILIRHAEKLEDGTKDPGLKPEGIQRAEKIVSLFAKTKIDAVYSTNFLRTKNTISPLAKSKGLEVQVYDAFELKTLDKILQQYAGGTIAISGHSNNIPAIANYLLARDEFKTFPDNEYGNVLIVSVMAIGKAKVVWLNY